MHAGAAHTRFISGVASSRIRFANAKLAMNALRLDGIWSITEGIAAQAHDIKGLLRLLGWREPATAVSSSS